MLTKILMKQNYKYIKLKDLNFKININLYKSNLFLEN